MSYEQLVNQIFNSEIQVKRVYKEIDNLKNLDSSEYKVQLKHNELGLKISIELQYNLLVNTQLSQLNNQQPIYFEVQLEKKFPFAFPKVICRSSVTDPSFADGRDILQDIIGKPWSPSILLYEIVQNIPQFLHIVQNNKDNKMFLQKLGQFVLGDEYDLEEFLSMNRVEVFPAQEITPENKTLDKYIVVSESIYLVFQKNEKSENIVTLSMWAHLQSLINIRRRQEKNNLLSISWRGENDSEGLTQILKINQSEEFVQLLVKLMQKYGVKVSKSTQKKGTKNTAVQDVTGQELQSLNIEQLEEEIVIQESQIYDNITLQLINSLMALYQKAIEYYSSKEDPQFQIYLSKLQDMVQKPEIQAILYSKQEVNDTKKNQVQEQQLQQQQQKQLQQQIPQKYSDNDEDEDEEEDEEEKQISPKMQKKKEQEKIQQEEQLRIQQEKEEQLKIQQEKEKQLKIQQEKEEELKIQQEEEELRIQQEKEEQQRIQLEKEEQQTQEKLQKQKEEKEEQERLQREQEEKEEQEKLQKEKEEKEEQEKLQREQEEKEEQEKLQREQEEKEEQEKLQREKEEQEKLQKEKEEQEKLQKEEQERQQNEEEQRLKDLKEQELKSKNVDLTPEQIEQEKEETVKDKTQNSASSQNDLKEEKQKEESDVKISEFKEGEQENKQEEEQKNDETEKQQQQEKQEDKQEEKQDDKQEEKQDDKKKKEKKRPKRKGK